MNGNPSQEGPVRGTGELQESADNGRAPMCRSCRHCNPSDSLHCARYAKEDKPEGVRAAKMECPEFESSSPIPNRGENPEQNRLLGGIFGVVVGDMLGVPVEFSTRDERDRDPVYELRADEEPFGTWSDDSSLMLCLMDAVISREDLFSRLRDNMISYVEGNFTPWGEMFDIGITTRCAITRMMQGEDPVKCGGRRESDNGNGSLMRILPLAFLYSRMDETSFVDLVWDVSSFTHGHPRSCLCCVFYTVMAGEMYRGTEMVEAWRRAADFTRRHGHEYPEELRILDAVLTGEVRKWKREQVKSSGYVVSSLEAALWALSRTGSYREAVVTAVNLGQDTDTVAAITGGLAGILYGMWGIPRTWLQIVARKEYILDLALRYEKAARTFGRL